jgi:hypothetical protein
MVMFRASTRNTLADDGFATHTALAPPVEPVQPPFDPLALPKERDDEAPAPGPWLDDPSYGVEAWLLGLADRIPVHP